MSVIGQTWKLNQGCCPPGTLPTRIICIAYPKEKGYHWTVQLPSNPLMFFTVLYDSSHTSYVISASELHFLTVAKASRSARNIKVGDRSGDGS